MIHVCQSQYPKSFESTEPCEGTKSGFCKLHWFLIEEEKLGPSDGIVGKEVW